MCKRSSEKRIKHSPPEFILLCNVSPFKRRVSSKCFSPEMERSTISNPEAKASSRIFFETMKIPERCYKTVWMSGGPSQGVLDIGELFNPLWRNIVFLLLSCGCWFNVHRELSRLSSYTPFYSGGQNGKEKVWTRMAGATKKDSP